MPMPMDALIVFVKVWCTDGVYAGYSRLSVVVVVVVVVGT